MRSRLLILICGALAISSIRGEDKSGSRQTWSLYSWRPPGQPWHFVILPDREPDFASETQVVRSPKALVGVEALKQYLRHSPSKSLAWRDVAPRFIVTYPPDEIVDDVLHYAKQHGIYVYLLPWIWE